MSAIDASTVVLQLKFERDELEPLNRTVTHCLKLASERELLADVSEGRHARRVPSTWGARRDAFFWDSWDWKVRGEDDLRRFFAIAQRIGGHLQGLENTEAASLLPGNVDETLGRRTDLYLPDYWLFVVHHLGWTDQLPYGCKMDWKQGRTFSDEPFCVSSRLPVNVVQASIDALSLDSVTSRAQSLSVVRKQVFTHQAAIGGDYDRNFYDWLSRQPDCSRALLDWSVRCEHVGA